MAIWFCKMQQSQITYGYPRLQRHRDKVKRQEVLRSDMKRKSWEATTSDPTRQSISTFSTFAGACYLWLLILVRIEMVNSGDTLRQSKKKMFWTPISVQLLPARQGSWFGHREWFIKKLQSQKNNDSRRDLIAGGIEQRPRSWQLKSSWGFVGISFALLHSPLKKWDSEFSSDEKCSIAFFVHRKLIIISRIFTILTLLLIARI